MRILILSKRQYTAKDLLDDEYGRLFEIPEELVKLGHEVHGITCSYRKRNVGSIKKKNVIWHSLNVIPFNIIDAIKHWLIIKRIAREVKPDVIWASSDAWNIIVASLVYKIAKIPFVADLYDNYESFTITKLPLIKPIFRWSCGQARGLTVVTNALSNFLQEFYSIKSKPIAIIGNAINPELFYPREKKLSREKFNLPISGILLGTAGALYENRGIHLLFEAFLLIVQKNPDIYLVIAGPRDKTVDRYLHTNIIDLGTLEQSQMPFFFSALDIGIICNIDSDFGRYCYPQKYEELAACGVPIIAAGTEEMLSLQANDQMLTLYDPENTIDLYQKILNKISTIPGSNIRKRSVTWESRAITLSKFLSSIPKN